MVSATSAKDLPGVLFPQALRLGDQVRIVAPAGPLERESVLQAKAFLEGRGFVVTLPKDLFRKHDYLAGKDGVRATELMDAFRDPQVRAIFPGRGGFGTMRILSRLDYEFIRAHPKIVIGYSDITALHLALQRRTGLVTFHSPNVIDGIFREEPFPEFVTRSFWNAVIHSTDRGPDERGQAYTIRIPGSEQAVRETSGLTPAGEHQVPQAMVPGVGEGRLTGGNLSLVHALMGTPFEIQTRDRVLFLEDIGEAPYRVDRMLSTLELAGKLDDLQAVMLGQFTRRKTEDTSGEVRTIRDVLRDYFADRGVPVLENFPAGHVRHNVTLPINARVRVDADQATVTVLEPPVRAPRD